MKRQLCDEWCVKLRHPESKQITDALETPYGNCCLGVLANICEVPKIVSENMSLFQFDDGSEEYASLPDNWCGIDVNQKGELIGMNDRLNYTFPQIADWIEANIPVED